MRAWYDIASLDEEAAEDERGPVLLNGPSLPSSDAERSRGVAARRIFLAGFSQGGAMALFTAPRWHERLGGVIALSCYMPLPATLASEANPSNASVPLFMAHGTWTPSFPSRRVSNPKISSARRAIGSRGAHTPCSTACARKRFRTCGAGSSIRLIDSHACRRRSRVLQSVFRRNVMDIQPGSFTGRRLGITRETASSVVTHSSRPFSGCADCCMQTIPPRVAG